MTTAGSPSGTAATASYTQDQHAKSAEAPVTSSTMTIVAIITIAIATTTAPSIFPQPIELHPAAEFQPGRGRFQHPRNPPHLGLIPSRITTARPRPQVTAVPVKIMLVRSPRVISAIGDGSFETGRLARQGRVSSPVCSEMVLNHARIAGTVSPSSTRMMSPGDERQPRRSAARRHARRAPPPFHSRRRPPIRRAIPARSPSPHSAARRSRSRWLRIRQRGASRS